MSNDDPEDSLSRWRRYRKEHRWVCKTYTKTLFVEVRIINTPSISHSIDLRRLRPLKKFH